MLFKMVRITGPILLVSSLIVLSLFGCKTGPSPDNPKSYVETMVDAVGGRDKFYALRDVEYEYTYRSKGKEDISIERYAFDGELSWAKFAKREAVLLPDVKGEIIQGYDGHVSWATLDGKLMEDPQALRLTDFLRKTNYYWFTMMFKLLDPGVNYAHKGTKTVDGIDYDLIEVTFNDGIGDAQDIYLLYINPETRLVDQFLFTVMDFGRKDPLLMKVEYEEVEGVKLPAKRRYVPANWEGVLAEDQEWTEEISTNIKFNNGFQKAMFGKPSVSSMSSKS
ncbi:hypothetical protein MJD09_25735 [bacterium]|nr:hypothetical protein [bacterium]